MQANTVITGSEELTAKLSKLGAGLTDFSDAFRILGPKLLDFYSDTVFSSKGGALSGSTGINGSQGEGVPWLNLSPSTVAYKTKHFIEYAAVPLMATGTMKKSFYYRAKSNSLEIGNTAPYFDFHQSNGDRTKLPRRPMLGVNKTVKSMIQQVLESDIRKKIGSL